MNEERNTRGLQPAQRRRADDRSFRPRAIGSMILQLTRVSLGSPLLPLGSPFVGCSPTPRKNVAKNSRYNPNNTADTAVARSWMPDSLLLSCGTSLWK